MNPLIRKVVNFTVATAIAGVVLTAPVAASEVHTVRSGESLWSIARQHHVDIDTLARINNIRDISSIREGMELKLSEAPQTHVIKKGETLWSISKNYGVGYQDLINVNDLRNPDKIYVGMEILLPGGAAKAKVSSKFIWPVKARISSKFGPRWGRQHEGIDFSLPIGREIIAAASGKVLMGGWIDGYGYTVIVEHEDGYRTLYAHNSKLKVTGGDYVKQGQVIALSGNSGRSTGPHLHFEIQKNGKPVNPLDYLK